MVEEDKAEEFLQNTQHSLKYQNVKENKEFKPIRALVVAPSGRGKSTFTSNWVIKMLKDKCFTPTRIIIYSQTYKDPKDAQRVLIDYCNKLYPEFEKLNCREQIDELELQELYETQKFIKEETQGHLHQFLILYDDQITSEVLTKKKSKICKIMTLGRRYNISQLLLLQSYRGAVDSLIRKNTTHIILGLLSSQDEIEDALKQYNGGLDDNKKIAYLKILNMYNQAIGDGFGFFVIHCDKINGQGKYQNGLKDYFDK